MCKQMCNTNTQYSIAKKLMSDLCECVGMHVCNTNSDGEMNVSGDECVILIQCTVW